MLGATDASRKERISVDLARPVAAVKVPMGGARKGSQRADDRVLMLLLCAGPDVHIAGYQLARLPPRVGIRTSGRRVGT